MAAFFELDTEACVDLEEGAGDGEADGTGLTVEAAADGGDDDVVFVGVACHLEGCEDGVAHRFGGEVVFERPVVDGDVAFTGGEAGAGAGRFAAACGGVNCFCHGMDEAEGLGEGGLELVHDGQLGLVVVFFAAIDAQLGVDAAAEAVVRDHAADGEEDDLFRAASAEGTGGVDVVTADVAGEAVVDLVDFLFAGEDDLVRIDDDDVVAVVDVRGVGDFIFAAEDIGGFDGDVAEDAIFGIDEIPFALNFLSFCGDGFHLSLKINGVQKLPGGGEAESSLRERTVKQQL